MGLDMVRHPLAVTHPVAVDYPIELIPVDLAEVVVTARFVPLERRIGEW